jgi:hypothetical protein
MERETLPGVGESSGGQTGLLFGQAAVALRRVRRVTAPVPQQEPAPAPCDFRQGRIKANRNLKNKTGRAAMSARPAIAN